jgi:hypothetical protein
MAVCSSGMFCTNVGAAKVAREYRTHVNAPE